jgi:hypothetical protein
MLSPRSRRQNKALGWSRRRNPGKRWKAVKPVKRAAVLRAVAHFVGFESFITALLGLTPQTLFCRLLRRLKSEL